MTSKPEREELMTMDDRTIERCLVRQFFFERDYAALLANCFDKRLFDGEMTNAIMSTAVQFFNEHGKTPDVMSELRPILINNYEKASPKPNYKLDALLEEGRICLNVDLPPTEEFLRKCVVDFIKRKRMYFAIFDNLKAITEKKDVSLCLGNFEKIMAIDFDSEQGIDYFKDMKKVLEDLAHPGARLPTGYPMFDRMIGGGIPSNEVTLTVFMAQPHLGKSMMLANLAMNQLKDGKFVVIITLEMSAKAYFSRFNAGLFGIAIKDVNASGDKVIARADELKQSKSKAMLIIKEYPESSISAVVIQNYLKTLIQKHGRTPDMVCVDYVNLMLPNHRNDKYTLYEKISVIGQELRSVSRTFKRPFVTATQTNRCLTLDTKVEIKENNNINEIYIKNIKVGDLIKGDGEYSEVIKVFPVQKQKILKITTKSGNIIRCGHEHLYPVDGKLIKAKDLKIGQYLSIEN